MKAKSLSNYISLPLTLGKAFFAFDFDLDGHDGDRNTCSIIAANDLTL